MKALWVLSIVLFSHSVMGSMSDEQIFSMSLEELRDVIVTGSTLTPTRVQLVPSAVTVFTRDEIVSMGFDYIDELVNVVPGFQSHRSAQTPLQNPISSRGRLISLEASELLVLIDGQRVDGPRSNGTTVAFPKISLEYIERVEFIRGPGSAIHGSNAMMGVINIVTRSHENQLSIGYGSFNRRQLSLQNNQKVEHIRLDIFAQTQLDDGDDYHLDDTFSSNKIDTDDPRQMGDLMVKISRHDTQLNFQHHEFQTKRFYELDGISNDFNKRNGRFSSVSLKHNFNWLNVDSWLRFSHKETKVRIKAQLIAEGGLAAISTPSSTDALFAIATFDDYTESHIQWHNSMKVNGRGSVQVGVEYRQVQSPQTVTENNFDVGDLASGVFPIRYYGEMLATTSIQGRSERELSAQYVQYQDVFLKRTHLTLGLRNDDVQSLGSQLTPRIGVVQELNESHSIKLLYGEAFRVPSESELFLENNPVLLGNPNLKPETVKSWDLIWMAQWKKSNLSLGYFESHFTDAIVEKPSELGVPRFENSQQDPIKGLEFEMSQQLDTHWKIRTTYTHISEKPDLSYREAERLFSITTNYHQGKWRTNLVLSYHGEREIAAVDDAGDRLQLDSAWLLWTKLSYDINSKMHGYLQVKNLSNKKDYSPTLGAALTQGVPNRDREVLLGLRWDF